MNKKYARELAKTITNEELLLMFENAKKGIKDWTKISSVNKSLTKGTAWNILAQYFDIDSNHHIIGKTNMIREFGEFLPSHLQPKKKTKKKIDINVVHQEPIFLKNKKIV